MPPPEVVHQSPWPQRTTFDLFQICHGHTWQPVIYLKNERNGHRNMFFAGVPRWLWNLFSPSVTKKTSFPSHTSSIIPLPWYHAFWLTSSPIPISSNIPGLCLTLNKPKSIRDNLHHESPVTILLRRDVKVAISTWSASRLKTGSWFSWEGGWCYHLEKTLILVN